MKKNSTKKTTEATPSRSSTPTVTQVEPNKFSISIDLSELRKRSLFVATPMYGGACAGMYTRSMIDLAAMCSQYQIGFKAYYLFNESLITRARNYCVDEFLRSGCTHLLFIDADIGFDPQYALTLLALQSDESPYDIICAPYPKKTIAWEKIRQAVNMGVADNDPNALDNYVGDYVFNPVAKSGSFSLTQPLEVAEAGTGFMMVRRKTFEVFDEHYPELRYKPDHVRTANFDGSREITAFFDTVIDPESRRYLSEDYMFCKWSRDVGLKVWICPWMELKHVGTYIFGGSLAALSQIGASLTADQAILKKR